MEIIFILLIFLLTLCWVYLRLSLAKTRGVSEIEGLNEAVDIDRDIHGVPHIRANNKHDAWFSLGYVHAQDRIWQLELQRRVCMGALSEVFGPSMLESDKLLRSLSLVESARHCIGNFPDDELAMIEAYVNGINAWISEKNWLPLEFYFCGLRPRIWRKLDVVAWSKMMSWTLSSNWQSELLRSKMICAVGVEKTEQLMGIQNKDSSIDVEALKKHQDILEKLMVVLKKVNQHLGFSSTDLGSNNWVVSGEHTCSGKPILASDPHLGASIPSVWYLVELNAKDISLAGASLPGLPSIIVGHNQHISWGITNSYADCQDLLINTINPDDQTQYRHQDSWHTFDEIEDIIYVRGEIPVRYKRRSTINGPVISDVIDVDTDTPITLCWTALDNNDTTICAFSRLNVAKNWDEFRSALQLFVSPSQNFVYADIEGNIGYQLAGKIPIRSEGSGQVPMSVGDESLWSSFIAFEKLPFDYNPKSGFIATANNQVLDEKYPYFVSQEWAPDYRFQRILELFTSATDNQLLDIDDIKAMQLDQVSLVAKQLLPYFLQLPAISMKERQALEYLAPWSGEMSIHKVAPTIFNMWYTELIKTYLLSDIEDDDLVNDYLSGRHPIFCVKWIIELFEHTSNAEGKINDKDTLDLLLTSFHQAINMIESEIGHDMDTWQWGKIHTLHFAHSPFDRMSWLSALFSRTIPSGGDPYTVSVGSYSYAKPFLQSGHPSYRQIICLSDWKNGQYAQSVGQSGNIFSKHYDDMISTMQKGDYLPMWYGNYSIPNSKRLQLLPVQSAY